AGEEVHRAADAAPLRVRRAPVGDAGALVDLVGAEDHRVDPAAARHLEGGDAVEERRAGRQRDELAGGVVDVGIDLGLLRHHAPVAEHAVLGVEYHVAALEVVRDHRGDADAEVHVSALAYQPGGVLRDALPGDGGLVAIKTRLVGRTPLGTAPRLAVGDLGRLHDALHEDAGKIDQVRRNRAGLHDLVDFDDGALRRL